MLVHGLAASYANGAPAYGPVIVDGTSSVGPTEHHDSFVERWTADLLAQASAKRVAEADRVVTESVNAAIDALGSAITRIATKYERATAED